jgi:hypothetical protein
MTKSVSDRLDTKDNLPAELLWTFHDPKGYDALQFFPALFDSKPEGFTTAGKTILETDYDFPFDQPPGHLWEYNCIGFTLLMEHAYLWPNGPATKATFDSFYYPFGYRPTDDETLAEIALYAIDGQVQHGAHRQPVGTVQWQSKLGASVRIAHEKLSYLSPLLPGPRHRQGYGSVLGFYKKSDSSSETTLFKQQGDIQRQRLALNNNEVSTVQSHGNRIAVKLQDSFSAAYSAWRRTWYSGANLISSDPNTRSKSREFQNLTSLGKNILPLLMNKLIVPQDFMALQAVQYLNDSVVVHWAIDDPANIAGEQGRAAATVKKWLSMV